MLEETTAKNTGKSKKEDDKHGIPEPYGDHEDGTDKAGHGPRHLGMDSSKTFFNPLSEPRHTCLTCSVACKNYQADLPRVKPGT